MPLILPRISKRCEYRNSVNFVDNIANFSTIFLTTFKTLAKSKNSANFKQPQILECQKIQSPANVQFYSDLCPTFSFSLPTFILAFNKKSYVLYSAVSSPLDRSKRFTRFALPDRPVHSDTNSASPGSILAMQQLRAKTKSLTFPPLSIAWYSFIQLSQQGRQWRERKCPIFETVAKGDSIASPAFYHWATALHK